MISIRDLLNKIKWDKNLNPDDFKIGYEDKILKTCRLIIPIVPIIPPPEFPAIRIPGKCGDKFCEITEVIPCLDDCVLFWAMVILSGIIILLIKARQKLKEAEYWKR